DLQKLLLAHALLNEICLLALRRRHLIIPLQKQHDDPLKSHGKAACRRILPGETPDHLVVSAAASDASRKAVDADLKDRTGVIGHSPHQSGVEDQFEVGHL